MATERASETDRPIIIGRLNENSDKCAAVQDREWKYVLDWEEETRIVTTGEMQMECAYNTECSGARNGAAFSDEWVRDSSGILRRMASYHSPKNAVELRELDER